MKKNMRYLLLIITILCSIVISACNKNYTAEKGDSNPIGLPTESFEVDDSIQDIVVVRFPLLDETDTYNYSDYYNSGLNFPETNTVIDTSKLHSKRTLSIQGTLYSANYSSTKLYSNDISNYLDEKKYDVYLTDEEVEIQVFTNSGVLKKLFFYETGLYNAPCLLNDFSESSLLLEAKNVLIDLYGASIQDYLGSYYSYEYSRLITYQNEEQNRYVVCYRAYINELPTDDVIYVQFTPTGKLWSVSAQKYTQYLNVKTDNLFPIDQLNERIMSFLEKMDYTKTSLRQKEPSCYYSMNIYGELYYISEWEAFKAFSDNSGVTCVEVLAVKAYYN